MAQYKKMEQICLREGRASQGEGERDTVLQTPSGQIARKEVRR